MSDEAIPIATARSARETGLGADALARAARRGELARLRRGAYAAADRLTAADAAARHRLLIRAARLAADEEPVFSHESAAALHGIPILGEWPRTVHTTVVPGHGGSSGAVMRTQRRLAPEDVVVTASGALATSPVRTAIDLAASRSLLGGIVAISHVRATGVPPSAFADALGRAGAMNGIGRARLALARSVAGAESVLEVLVVVRCQDYGFAVPELQREVRGTDGRNYRVDFAWLDGRVFGEADGRRKYQDPELLAGRSAEEVVWAEKRREDAIRFACERFLRLGWEDAWRGVGLARLLDAAGVPRVGRRLAALTF